jgi:hypothetical protein
VRIQWLLMYHLCTNLDTGSCPGFSGRFDIWIMYLPTSPCLMWNPRVRAKCLPITSTLQLWQRKNSPSVRNLKDWKYLAKWTLTTVVINIIMAFCSLDNVILDCYSTVLVQYSVTAVKAITSCQYCYVFWGFFLLFFFVSSGSILPTVLVFKTDCRLSRCWGLSEILHIIWSFIHRLKKK